VTHGAVVVDEMLTIGLCAIFSVHFLNQLSSGCLPFWICNF